MNYESFRSAWDYALTESRLRTIGLYPVETLETRNLDREYKVYLEPLGGQDSEPFHVTATVCWRWDALQTARAATKDEDVLSQMLGRRFLDGVETEKPYVRVDIKLQASAPYGKPIAMPAKGAWAQWLRETKGRLENIEPLIPEESIRENDEGWLEVLGWKGDLKAKIVCHEGGELLLESVEIAAFQIIELPRVLDGFDREPDDGPRSSSEACSTASGRRCRHGCRQWITCDQGHEQDSWVYVVKLRPDAP